MSRTRRNAVAMLACTLIGVGWFAGPASAAVPDNDTQPGAVAITLPFDYTQSTAEATVDAGETAASDYCLGVGAPAFEHAVWFKAEVPVGFTDSVRVDVSGSNFGAGIAVIADFGAGPTVIGCSPQTYVSPGAPPAGTYYLVVFGDGTTAATGGTLHITADVPPPPPSVSLTINGTGTATKSGGAWVSGTVTCSGGGAGAQLFEVGGTVSQTVGRLIITSSFFVDATSPCDGIARPWSGYAPPTNGKFAGGKAATVSYAFGCGNSACNSAYAEAVIKLNRSPLR